MIKFLKIMLMALPVFVLSSSCVKEDLDDCDNVTIISSIWQMVIRTYYIST